jgi:hypothetical protein
MVPPGSTVRLSRDHHPGYTGQVPRQQADGLLADGVDLLAEHEVGAVVIEQADAEQAGQASPH